MIIVFVFLQRYLFNVFHPLRVLGGRLAESPIEKHQRRGSTCCIQNGYSVATHAIRTHGQVAG